VIFASPFNILLLWFDASLSLSLQGQIMDGERSVIRWICRRIENRRQGLEWIDKDSDDSNKRHQALTEQQSQ